MLFRSVTGVRKEAEREQAETSGRFERCVFFHLYFFIGLSVSLSLSQPISLSDDMNQRSATWDMSHNASLNIQRENEGGG